MNFCLNGFGKADFSVVVLFHTGEFAERHYEGSVGSVYRQLKMELKLFKCDRGSKVFLIL